MSETLLSRTAARLRRIGSRRTPVVLLSLGVLGAVMVLGIAGCGSSSSSSSSGSTVEASEGSSGETEDASAEGSSEEGGSSGFLDASTQKILEKEVEELAQQYRETRSADVQATFRKKSAELKKLKSAA